MATTMRAQFRAALVGILEDFQTANPTLLRQTYRARPASFHPPMAYVGPITEPTIQHKFGARRRRLMRAPLLLVEGLYENAETSDRLDVLADAMIDYLTIEHDRVSGRTLLQAVSSEEVELDLGGGTIYAATSITVEHDVEE